MKKGIIIILDGLGDRPSVDLDGLTALEAAATPFMDGLLRKGCCGLIDPLCQMYPLIRTSAVGGSHGRCA